MKIRFIPEIPPHLVTLGWMLSTASASKADLNSCNVVIFSPAEIGTPSALTSANPIKSSGGQTGSSNQWKPSYRISSAMAFASATVQGQFTSRHILSSCSTALRAALNAGTVVSCSFIVE